MNNRSNQLNPNNKSYHSIRNKLYNLSVFIGEFINKIDFEIELDKIEVNEILKKEKQIKILEKERQLKLEKERQIKLEKERQIKLEKERQIKLEKERQIKLEKERQSKLEERKRIAKIRENHFINNKVEEKEINNNKKKDDIPECPICLDDINEPSNMYITECCHKYHLDCMTKFSKYNNNKCPVCKHRINLSSLKNKQKSSTRMSVTETIRLRILQRRNINPAPERRGRSPSLERRGRRPAIERRGRSPSLERRGRRPAIERRGRSPNFERKNRESKYCGRCEYDRHDCECYNDGYYCCECRNDGFCECRFGQGKTERRRYKKYNY
jgi:hypothetical protein